MKIIDPRQIENYYKALVERNADYVGKFYAAVKTTAIFCIPTCSARKPKFKNVDYYTTTEEIISEGYRACMRCRPLE
jgi:AraC family transcriptional regulator, regulatory protein of adaptative response / methylated-DNA-[protein]-cysteine methyltransferase